MDPQHAWITDRLAERVVDAAVAEDKAEAEDDDHNLRSGQTALALRAARDARREAVRAYLSHVTAS